MSYLVSDLVTRVQRDKLDDTSFSSTILLDFLNDTEREVYNRYRLNQNEQQLDTVTTTAASRDLTGLPTSPAVQTYISLQLISPVNYSKKIPYVSYEDADLFYPNYNLLGQGPPIAWFIFDGTPHLLNLADKTYTISVKYVAQPGKLSSQSDTPNIPEEFSELAVLGMYARALEFNDEFTEAAAIRAQFDRLARDYVDATRRVAGVPHVMRQPRNFNRNIRIR